MVELELLYPVNLPHRYRLYPVVTSIIPSPTPVFLEVASGLNTDVTLTDRTALSAIRCNTGPTPQEVVPPEVVHPPSTVSSRLHGDADQDHLATLRTPQHGSTLLRSTVGQSLTSSLPWVILRAVTVSVLSVDSRVSMPQLWI